MSLRGNGVGLGRLMASAVRPLLSFTQHLLGAYAQIFLVDDWKFGGVVAALTFIFPNVGISGLLSLLIALTFGYALGIRKAYQWNNTYLRNVILIGLSVGYVFRLQWTTVPLLAAISTGTLLLTIAITRVATPLQLPVMSLPFAIGNIFLSVATLRYDHIYQMTIFHQADAFWGPEFAPELIKGFCFAMAYVVFQSNFLIGAGLAPEVRNMARCCGQPRVLQLHLRRNPHLDGIPHPVSSINGDGCNGRRFNSAVL